MDNFEMTRSIFISTCALKQIKTLRGAITLLIENGIRNIELSSCHPPAEKEIHTEFDASFIVHNYYPPPRRPFVLNLASRDDQELKKSINHALESIKLSADLNAPFYAVHGGFTSSGPITSVGINFTTPPTNKSKSMQRLVNSMKILVKEAEDLGVVLAVENNTTTNIVKGQVEEYVLLHNLEQIQRLFQEVRSEYLGVLLDFGHLNISSLSGKYSREEFVKGVHEWVVGLHLHDNNRLVDSHAAVSPNSWFIPLVKRYFRSRKIVPVLEPHGISLDHIKENFHLIQEIMS